MGKNRRSVFSVLDTLSNTEVQVDSQEEVDVYKWLLKAVEMGIISQFQYQPGTFMLAEAVKYKNSKGKSRTLFQDHVYSPDFLLTVNPQYPDLMNEFKMMKDNQIYIDVKGTFNKTGRSFSIDQKWMYQKYGLYIYKLVPKEFFGKFGIVEELKFTQKTKKPSKKYEGFPMIDDVFKSSRSVS